MSDPFIGEIRMVGFNFPPRGWAFCNGALLPISQNTALFSLLGTEFGGDGQVTFGLPNLLSRSPIGAVCPYSGDPPGLSSFPMGTRAGTESYTLMPGNVPMPMHTHTATGMVMTGSATTSTPSDSTLIAAATDADAGITYSNFASSGTPTALASNFITVSPPVPPSTANTPIPLLSPFLAVNFIIALVGIYPSRQ